MGKILVERVRRDGQKFDLPSLDTSPHESIGRGGVSFLPSHT